MIYPQSLNTAVTYKHYSTLLIFFDGVNFLHKIEIKLSSTRSLLISDQ